MLIVNYCLNCLATMLMDVLLESGNAGKFGDDSERQKTNKKSISLNDKLLLHVGF